MFDTGAKLGGRKQSCRAEALAASKVQISRLEIERAR
jgi:hypothetical protein